MGRCYRRQEQGSLEHEWVHRSFLLAQGISNHDWTSPEDQTSNEGELLAGLQVQEWVPQLPRRLRTTKTHRFLRPSPQQVLKHQWHVPQHRKTQRLDLHQTHRKLSRNERGLYLRSQLLRPEPTVDPQPIVKQEETSQVHWEAVVADQRLMLALLQPQHL